MEEGEIEAEGLGLRARGMQKLIEGASIHDVRTPGGGRRGVVEKQKRGTDKLREWNSDKEGRGSKNSEILRTS